jgi:hypothetical protein
MVIDPQVVRNALQMFEAELQLWQAKLDAWNRRGEKERNFLTWFVDSWIDPGKSRTPLREYSIVHKEHYRIEAQLMELQIAKLKSEVAIRKAMLAEAEDASRIIDPKGQVRM